MAQVLLRQLIAFAGVFAVLGLATALSKGLRVGTEGSRKLVHILLSHWILLAAVLFDTPVEACVAPACFIVLNYISYKKGTFSAIERKEDNSPGTVWYAVSLFVLCAVFFTLGKPYIAVCGMLAMGWGDGFAALVGMRWGRRKMPAPMQSKSALGCATAFVLSALPVGIVCAAASPAGWFWPALAAGGVSCALELCSPRGIDNLTLPLGAALTVLLVERWPEWAQAMGCLALTLLVLAAAFGLRAISLPGAGAALALGMGLYLCAGWWCYAALIAFFVLGSAVSRFGNTRKQSAASLHKRGGARGVAQVAANGLPCLVFALAYAFTGWGALLLASFACLAAANADTFSSELGMLSRKAPVSILGFRPVDQGISGGVSALGFGGAALGALMIALLALPRFGLVGMLAVTVLGVLGSVVDSLLGALAQVKYRHPDGGLTEKQEIDGVMLVVARGLRWMDNDMVNFLSGLAGGALCVLLGVAG